jgi:hypothetical protein
LPLDSPASPALPRRRQAVKQAVCGAGTGEYALLRVASERLLLGLGIFGLELLL